MAPIGWPPVLAVCHQGSEVFFECCDVQLFDLFTVIHALEGIGLAVLLVQDVQLECVGPPLHGGFTLGCVGAVHHGTFGLGRHKELLVVSS